ncbi:MULTISPECIES: NYN domain-containing protein [Myroides]|uniref:NYN domain-containing protein n=1 Tax=Myroides albus TaxID=2562892 RepID=A0A6I3LKV6_9FLAO|nr:MULTISPECIES: NYN domain-containing protein [Myroides]MTG98347.1 NYN domain-containing protein [Myroides albus]MVX36545.1 NYN domain-containing protein [Myroides sp. LoEW2-1]UVD80341.1 NYN domain-containing protein [Myroides albus]
MEKHNNNIAILVDGDNAQAKLLDKILEEVSKYGKVTIRRIYGDWTTPQMNSWKDLLNDLSFSPMQKFNYTSGKNSTDSSLIIDAMDILHDKAVDGFCIVSSDSDYTGLAKRIREEGIFVMGVGEKKTPNAFVQSCEIFTYCETLMPKESTVKGDNGSNKKSAQSDEDDNKTLTKKEYKLIDRAFDMSVDEEVEAYIATVGQNLRKLNPSFDARDYGFRNLTEMFKHLKTYEVINNNVKGLNHPLVKKK